MSCWSTSPSRVGRNISISEKYEIKVRDWNKPGNIKAYIARLNRIRRDNPALQQTSNLHFVPVDDGQVIGFVKESTDGGNSVAVAIALDKTPRQFWFHFGDLEIGPPGARRVAAVEDLVTGERRGIEWGGVRLYVDPGARPRAAVPVPWLSLRHGRRI